MPYIHTGRRQGVVLVALLVAGLLVPAAASAAPPPPPMAPPDWIANTLSSVGVTGPTCTDPTFGQPFQGLGDQAYYTLAPGESDSSFTGDGWILQNGANITAATLADGSTGDVLDLPSGSLAVSPPMCIAANYPTARTMVRNVSGGGGVAVFVTYAGTSTWTRARNGGNAHGKGNAWGLSDKVSLQPSNTPGWQVVRFALAPDGGHNDYQVYDFYVDPYFKG